MEDLPRGWNLLSSNLNAICLAPQHNSLSSYLTGPSFAPCQSIPTALQSGSQQIPLKYCASLPYTAVASESDFAVSRWELLHASAREIASIMAVYLWLVLPQPRLMSKNLSSSLKITSESSRSHCWACNSMILLRTAALVLVVSPSFWTTDATTSRFCRPISERCALPKPRASRWHPAAGIVFWSS